MDNQDLNEEQENQRIIPINIVNEMESAYIDYSMSVIVSRALPDVRDGLKPVHRRILYGMHELGLMANRAHKKSARVVGEVLGKYHPHGDSSVYDAMVRMAQEWSLRYQMVDGQGNFGSIDGDSPAAMRYTEARLRKMAEEMLSDIEKDTVDFQLNFDDTLKEPTVLPTRIPSILVNGASGIAVGMATNMAPHNLTEVLDGIIKYIETKGEIELSDLMNYIKAPDFPTGGIIYGYEGVKQAYETGKGRVVLRSKTHFEELKNNREAIVVTEIPYQVNKSEMIKKTADLINQKKLEGISDIRDESDRRGMRIVYVLKRDAIPNIVLNKLFKYTQLQSSFSINNIALVKGRPKLLNLKQIIQLFVAHRHEVLIRKTKFDLKQAEKRAHILKGLLVALDNLDDIISLIKKSQTPEEARNGLINNYNLTEIQAKAILDLRLQKLTGLERDKIKFEHQQLMDKIKNLNEILNNEDLRLSILIEDFKDVKEKFGDERRTQIEYSSADLSIEDMIPNEKVVITISHLGYIKRTPLSEYRQQNRGGVGHRGASSRDEDFLEHIFIATNHNYMLFFSQNGKCFWLKVYEIPEGSKTAKGRAIQNLINIPSEDKIMAFINVDNLKDENYINSNYILMCTKKGVIKKTSLESYSRPRQNGIKAINIREDDQLLEAKLTNGSMDIMMALKSGKCIRFNEEKARSMGRGSTGVRGIRLANEKDQVIGMICVDDVETEVLVVSENGYGKRSKVNDYRTTNRGGKGVKTINITDKTGNLIAIKNVKDGDDLMIINKSGITIRMSVDDMRVMGRATQGVRLINLKNDDIIAAVAKVEISDEEKEDSLEQNLDNLKNPVMDSDKLTDENNFSSEDSNNPPEILDNNTEGVDDIND
ncbi:MAG: DNA gyrase subunit A [Bacteroidota bacterium]|nr:DNA gyrase subunit A [Bacteroidota bacterium]